jgi:ribose transport system permease protein
MGAAVGLANGLLITWVRIDSFIATLGAGTILYGLNAWCTGGQQVLASLPPAFLAISGGVWIVPAPAIYALIVSLALWVVFEYLPLGRYLYVLGATSRWRSLRRECSRRSPESCCRRSSRSARARWVRNICCRLSRPRSLARLQSARVG